MALASEQLAKLPNAPRDFRTAVRELGLDDERLVRHVLEDADRVNEPGIHHDRYRLLVENAALKAKIRKLEHKLHAGRLRARRLDARLTAAGKAIEIARPYLENYDDFHDVYGEEGVVTGEHKPECLGCSWEGAIDAYDEFTARPEDR